MSFARALIGSAAKYQEEFQVESLFCKTITCSYVTLLTTYLAQKTMLKVSSRSTRKRCLLISKITLKSSELRIYTNLQSSPMPFNFNNSRPIYVILWEMRNHYRNIWFMKNSKCQHFLSKCQKHVYQQCQKQPQNGQIFRPFTLYSKGRHFSITKLDILIFCNILHLKIGFEWNLSWKRIVFS